MTFDVLVIGGGIAGFSAALAAQQRGARTALVRAAPGVSALTSGAWSGPLPPGIGTALEAQGYALQPAPQPLVHERGRLVAADFAESAHTRATADAGATVCGIAGLPHFNANVLARLWNPGRPLPAVHIELPDTPAGGWTAASLAAQIERHPDAVARALESGGQFIFPAVLGLESAAAVISHLKTAGIDAQEALAASPSVPGWRLLKAMDRALAAANVTIITGTAAAGGNAGGRVHDIRVAGDVVTAKSFVLATGKYTAGGIATTGEFRESVFDFPIWLEHLGDVFQAPDPLPLTDPARTEEQPLLSAGVHTDDEMHPIDRTGQPLFSNVFVAGTIRAGWSAALSGLGNCAQDGWSAGVNASA
jgi:glycerol-3-phosphate dehydrogenase subunit B